MDRKQILTAEIEHLESTLAAAELRANRLAGEVEPGKVTDALTISRQLVCLAKQSLELTTAELRALA